MEAYPLAIRHHDTDNSSYKRHWGDWVMGQYYMNLRIGDLIPNAVQPEPVKIDAPVITPHSATFNSVDHNDRPEITISHNNYKTYAAMVKATGDRWSYYISAKDYDTHRGQEENAYVGVGITSSRVLSSPATNGASILT